MRVVVFGGSGFLGSHVADALSADGHDVVIYDIRKSPYLLPGQTMFVGDILDVASVEKAVQGCDVIYNFAGIADIDECADRPVDAVKYNIMGNTIALEAARKADIKRFIFASSVYVYSESGAIYSSSKRACELFIEDYQRLYGLPYTIARYGSLYGERASGWNSIHRLIREALSTGKITYYGSGDELREWIHVKDAARLSVQILQPEFENQHIILAGNQLMKYRELLEMIREIIGSKAEIVYKPKQRVAHYKLTPYSFSPKLGRKLTINPHIDLGQGILMYIAEIHSDLHKEKHEEMGFFLNSDETEVG
jgi:UDP-glucose 4-epimerase